jgi:YaiO family outer membrane protein
VAGRIHLLLILFGMFGTYTAALAVPSFDEIDSAIATADYDRALTLIDTQLATAPQDVQLRLRRARVHSYLGNDTVALQDLDALRSEHPYDVDYALARARILARQGRDDEALEDLRQAVVLAPDYEDVWQLRYALLARHSDEAARRERESVLSEAAVRFPDAYWWRSDEPADDNEWTVVVGAGHEDLNNDLPSWNRQFVEVSRDHDDRGRYRIGAARDERFNSADVSASVGGDLFFGSDWSAGIDFTFVDGANFQPDFAYSAYAGRSIRGGWVFNLRYRRREYESATVGSTTGMVEKYVGDFRIAYALGLSHLHGESNSMSHGLTVNWYYSDISSIGLSFNTGEEAESIVPGQVLETEVRGITLVGRREFSNRLALQWWLGTHDQGDFYRRQYLGMALTLRL